ncbi:MAG: alpha/beta hydrolase [Gammaproteobacteria bacterium]|nr:alpha/beta hydrolase [Gammaproteobacteria bacterium]
MLDETPLFFENSGQKLFGVIHKPDNLNINKAIVFCHAFAEEKLWSHRVYVSLARSLVKLGYLVMRFDYRGYGDSEGDFSSCSITSYKSDIQCAVEYLRNEYSGLTEIGLFGHRLGASIAVNIKDEININGPIILWDPITDGDRYMQEFLRSHLSTQLAIYNEIRETRDQLVEKLEQGEMINVEGYDLSIQQFESITNFNLINITSTLSSKCLIVQTGRNEKPKKDIKLLSDSLGAELLVVKEEPFWREIKQFYFEAKNMNSVTLEWISENYG